MTTFGEWLINEMKIRGMSQAALARSSKLTTGAISHLISGNRQPGPDACNAIADAFNYPPDYVFRVAGLLPELEDDDPPGLEELEHLYRIASEALQREILDFARFKSNR